MDQSFHIVLDFREIRLKFTDRCLDSRVVRSNFADRCLDFREIRLEFILLDLQLLYLTFEIVQL